MSLLLYGTRKDRARKVRPAATRFSRGGEGGVHKAATAKITKAIIKHSVLGVIDTAYLPV
jgi:hypothetical protein